MSRAEKIIPAKFVLMDDEKRAKLAEVEQSLLGSWDDDVEERMYFQLQLEGFGMILNNIGRFRVFSHEENVQSAQEIGKKIHELREYLRYNNLVLNLESAASQPVQNLLFLAHLAVTRLALGNMRLIVDCIKKMGLAAGIREDHFVAGYFGLYAAAATYDPWRNLPETGGSDSAFKFSSWAFRRIRWSILSEQKFDERTALTKAATYSLQLRRRSQEFVERFMPREEDLENLALVHYFLTRNKTKSKRLSVRPQDVREEWERIKSDPKRLALFRKKSATLISTGWMGDMFLFGDKLTIHHEDSLGESDFILTTVEDYLDRFAGGDPDQDLDRRDYLLSLKQVINQWLNALSKKQRGIITSHFGLDGNAPKTLTEIAGELQITRSRVGQIIYTAFRRLRKVKDELRDFR